MSVLPPGADIVRPSGHVRKVPQNQTHALQHLTAYSITSSARPSSVGGILNPIVRAVLRLNLSRNLVGNSTGRSDGFLPLRILSTNVAHSPASAPISGE